MYIAMVTMILVTLLRCYGSSILLWEHCRVTMGALSSYYESIVVLLWSTCVTCYYGSSHVTMVAIISMCYMLLWEHRHNMYAFCHWLLFTQAKFKVEKLADKGNIIHCEGMGLER